MRSFPLTIQTVAVMKLVQMKRTESCQDQMGSFTRRVVNPATVRKRSRVTNPVDILSTQLVTSGGSVAGVNIM